MAKLSSKMASGLMITIIVLVIAFQVLADTATDVGAAAGNMSEANATGVESPVNDAVTTYPLTSFFKKKGIVLLALMAGVVITILTAVFVKK